jgi:hypothetical protein
MAAANTSPRTGTVNVTRRSNRLAGRPPTTEVPASNRRITKNPRKQPSRRNESNTDRIAGAVEENEQASQPTRERTPPAEESASEQRPQPTGEGTQLAGVLANEQSGATPPAEVSVNEQRLQTAGERSPPTEVVANERILQTANERIPSAEVAVDANNGRPFYYDYNGSLVYPARRYDEDFRYPGQPMSDGQENGSDQGGDQGGREAETPADGSVHSPAQQNDEELRYPNSPDQYERLHWYEDGERVVVHFHRRYPGGRRPYVGPGHYEESDDEGSGESPAEPDGEPDVLDADPAPPYDDYAEEQLLKVLFASVTTQRALRRKREELRSCRQDIQDANLVVRGYQTGLNELVPNTEYDWIMHRAIQRKDSRVGN